MCHDLILRLYTALNQGHISKVKVIVHTYPKTNVKINNSKRQTRVGVGLVRMRCEEEGCVYHCAKRIRIYESYENTCMGLNLEKRDIRFRE